ncbi:MAG: ABC transporter ATP-binding protein [Rikenellaceae bacterium]
MIEARNITIWHTPAHPILQDASFTLQRGELVALLGRNGAGKSTLMRAIAALQPIRGGEIVIDGELCSRLTEQQRALLVAIVTTDRIRIPGLSCFDLVALGRTPHTNWIGSLSDYDREVVEASLAQVDASHLTHIDCDTLSDGELQRIMIARALAQQTPIIMLDEPTAFLDMPSRHQLLQLLQHLAHTQQKCIIYSSHELSLALKASDRVAIIHPPQLLIHTPQQVRQQQIIAKVFGITDE